MDKDFYVKEFKALQNLVEKLTHVQSEQAIESNDPKPNYDLIIVSVIVFMIVSVSIGLLTYWLIK